MRKLHLSWFMSMSPASVSPQGQGRKIQACGSRSVMAKGEGWPLPFQPHAQEGLWVLVIPYPAPPYDVQEPMDTSPLNLILPPHQLSWMANSGACCCALPECPCPTLPAGKSEV